MGSRRKARDAAGTNENRADRMLLDAVGAGV
jgi:hypothetical protein